MTKAVSSGNTADPTAILADLTNQMTNNISTNKNTSPNQTIAIKSNDSFNSSSKYPNLDKFLSKSYVLKKVAAILY